MNTYDWTDDAVSIDMNSSTLDDLCRIGQRERDAVMGADVVVVLLPAGKSTHVELGLAIARHKRTILYSPAETINNPAVTSMFYYLPELETCWGTLDDVVDQVVGREAADTLV